MQASDAVSNEVQAKERSPDGVHVMPLSGQAYCHTIARPAFAGWAFLHLRWRGLAASQGPAALCNLALSASP